MVAIFLHIVLLFFIGLMLLAAAWDVTRFTIPNWLCVAVAILFPVAALLSGMGWELAGLHLLSGVLAFVLGFALFATGTLGGGDAKLFAAASLWFAWPVTLAYLFALVLAGGVFALVLLIVRYSAPHAAALIRTSGRRHSCAARRCSRKAPRFPMESLWPPACSGFCRTRISMW